MFERQQFSVSQRQTNAVRSSRQSGQRPTHYPFPLSRLAHLHNGGIGQHEVHLPVLQESGEICRTKHVLIKANVDHDGEIICLAQMLDECENTDGRPRWPVLWFLRRAANWHAIHFDAVDRC